MECLPQFHALARALLAGGALLAVVAVSGVPTAVAAPPKAAEYSQRYSAFKGALKGATKKEPGFAKELLPPVREFAGTADYRVFKELFKSLRTLDKAVEKGRDELDEASEALRKIQKPYWDWVEREIERTGRPPDLISRALKESMDQATAVQREAARIYDLREQMRRVVSDGLGTTLAAMGEARAEAWKGIVDLGTRSKDPEERAAFCRALGVIGGADAEGLLLEMESGDKDVAVTMSALEALAATRSQAGFDRLVERLGSEDWRVAVTAVKGIAQYRDARVFPPLIGRLESAEDRVLDDLLEALHRLTGKHNPATYKGWKSWWDKEGAEFVDRWSKDKAERSAAITRIAGQDPEQVDVVAELVAMLRVEAEKDLRLEVLTALAQHTGRLARVTLLEALQDDDREVRIAAARSLAHYRHVNVPPALMRRVRATVPNDPADEPELLALFESMRTLWGGEDEFTVTAPSRTMLVRWWDLKRGEVGDHFIKLGAKNVGSDEDEPRRGKKLEAQWVDRNFYGLTVRSTRVLFVIDVSRSMNEKQKKTPQKDDKSPNPIKIDVAKRELQRVLQSLPEDALFGIIAFAQEPAVYESGMMAMSPKRRAAAVEYVKGMKLGLGTNVYDTLEIAFLLGTPRSPVKSAGLPDTIFFLSDGQASVGKFVKSEKILELVTEMNRGRGVKIHCIGVGEGHDGKFLNQLAEANGGQYVAR